MWNPIVRILRYILIFIKRIFCPGNYALTNIVPFLMMLSLIFYQILEYEYSSLIATVNKIVSNTTIINPYTDIISHNSFVYFVANSMEYPILSDTEFGVQTHAAIIKRSIDYCQWLEEGFDSTDKITRTRRYMKVWVKELIDSSEFMDLRYYNPPHKLNIDDSYIISDTIQIGSYTIDSNIFEISENSFTPFSPDDNQSALLSNFNTSFLNIGNGYFYFYHNESQKLSLPHKNLEDCTPGDIRVQISQFSPQMVSVIGNYNETSNKISLKRVGKYKIGNLEAGNVPLKKLLISRYHLNRILITIIKVNIFLGASFFIIKQSTSQIDSICKFIEAALIVLHFRFLIRKDAAFLGIFIFITVSSFLYYIYSQRAGNIIFVF